MLGVMETEDDIRFLEGVIANLLKRRTQKDEQFWGKIINLDSNNLRWRSLKGYPRGTPKREFWGGIGGLRGQGAGNPTRLQTSTGRNVGL